MPWPLSFPYWELLEDEPPLLHSTGKEKKMAMVHIPMVSFPYHSLKWCDGGKDDTTPFLKENGKGQWKWKDKKGCVWLLPLSMVRSLLSGKGMKGESPPFHSLIPLSPW